MQNRRIRSVVGLALFVLAGVASAHAWVSDEFPLWPEGAIPMQLQLDPAPPSQPLLDGSTSWNQVAIAALSDWNQYLTVSKFTWADNSTAPVAAANGSNNVFWSDTIYGESWGSSMVGITLKWTVNDVRTEADVIFNRSAGHNWNSYRGPLRPDGTGQYLNDLRRIALHEFGHALCLDHPDTHGQSVVAIMNSVSNDVDDLQADDIAGVQHFYQAALPPVITTQPVAAQTVAPGGAATFVVNVGGTPPFAYQWYKNNVALTGSSVYQSYGFSFPAVQTSQAGTYTVVITNSAGSVTSQPSVLTVGNVAAPTLTTQPADQAVSLGGTALFEVVATGSAPLAYQWYKDGTAISGATAATYSIASVNAASAGSYYVTVSNPAGSVTSNPAALTLTTIDSWLSNLSVRANMAADQTLIVGITVADGTEKVLVRGIGPGLAQFLAPETVMANPRLALFPNGAATATFTNDDWDAALAPTFSSAGAFGIPVGSADAAFVRPMHDNNNTVSLQGTGPGIVLVEVYGLGTSTTPRLTNISARNFVGTGDNVLIAGFGLSGRGTKRLLIRAIGPGLKPFGVTGVLEDPTIQIYAGNNSSVPIATNDNWDAAQAGVFASVGAFGLPAGSLDSAVIVTVDAGAQYSAVVKGANDATGEALVEVYELK